MTSNNICLYGLTLFAEANGDLGVECHRPVKHNTTEKQDGKPVDLSLCNMHYKKWLIWESQRVI
jgi:hypothetical protein